jgi:DNA-binding transcriptional LysR family regulator
MRYSLDEIETFLTVMELGTVTAAAARLNLSKSVVSKRIGELELGLGVALFRRHAGRIQPTEAAERLVERMRPALVQLRAAAESAAWGGSEDEVLRGTLSIAAPMSFGTLHLTPILARFSARHPGLDLRLDYDDRMRDLAREGFDLAVRVGQFSGTALMSRKLCEDRTIACAAPAFLARHGRPETVADLNGLPAVGYSHMADSNLWQFRAGGHLVSPAVEHRLSANNGEAMRDIAIAGLAIAMLPGFIAAPAIAAGRLEALLPEIETRSLPVMAVWPPVQPMPSKVRLLVDHMVKELAGGAPWLGQS